MQTDRKDDDLLKLALAMELFHAGLLIHDDIMDNAETRRGMPSLHTAYTELLNKRQARYPKNSGRSLAICAGNVSFFLGMQLLSETDNPKITTFCAKELQTVNYAQMQDIALGAAGKPVEHLEEILSLYQNKTGRYSVLLPLTLGAMLGGAKEATLKHIAKFSDSLGIAYQLVDDTLDLFGNPQKTGKAVGTDIREGKQTPYIFFLRQLNDQADSSRIDTLFAKGETTPNDIAWVQANVREHHIDEKITEMIETYKKEAIEAISRIPMKQPEHDLFVSFVEYLTNRIQ
jgi:geranylgeranyl diphosphate synthase type I